MVCRDIIEELEKKYPPSIAEAWDNPGLQAGRFEKEIKRVYIALDATDRVIRHAVEAGADMLLTHHPMLMGGVKRVNTGDFYGRRLITLIQHDICCYAMHTNYDIVMMAPLASRLLKLQQEEILAVTGTLPDGREGGFGMVGNLPEKMSLADCAAHVKSVFGIPKVKVFGGLETEVYRAAVLPGSGKSMMQDAIRKGAQVYISGDFGHHDGIDAVDQGLCVIDAGHYGIEHIYIKQMKDEMTERFSRLEVLAEPVCHPFEMI